MKSRNLHHYSDRHQVLYQSLVDEPFNDRLQSTTLGLGVVVLLLADYDNNALRRIALSNTEMAAGAVKYSVKPFSEIVIPLDCMDNILVKAIVSQKPQSTVDWANMFTPALSPEEARLNQAGAGIACSWTYPLLADNSDQAIGTMIFSYFEPLGNIGPSQRSFMKSYASKVASALRS